MFNATQVTIDEFVERLKENYLRTYGHWEPEFPNIIAFCGRLALENIANSDAAYHDVSHTIMVTDVGQAILRGRHISEGGVLPKDWLEFVVSLLCHDIGYVRGVCRGDREGNYVIDESGKTIRPPIGATDAFMTPYHVVRSKLFVRERFGKVKVFDHRIVEANIEHTRFPVPNDDEKTNSADYPGLVRAADLIGQMADIDYLRKVSFLYQEFKETGASDKLGYTTAADLRHSYPTFFWKAVRPHIEDGLRYLQITQEGKQWIACLYGNVFAAEHNAPGLCREI